MKYTGKIDSEVIMMRDSIFVDCDLTEASFLSAQVTNTQFINCNISTDFTAAFLTNVTFLKCKGRVDFSGANLTSCYFHECNLKDSKFEGAYLNNIDFTDSILQGADFTSAYLNKYYRGNWTGVLYEDTYLKRPPLILFGFPYKMQLMGEYLRIGCEEKTLEEWRKVTKEEYEYGEESEIYYHIKDTLLDFLENYLEIDLTYDENKIVRVSQPHRGIYRVYT